MKRAFNAAASLRIIREGLIKPNPANPSIPMWTVEDFDEPTPHTKYNEQHAKENPSIYGPWKGVTHVNPVEEFRGMSLAEIDEKLHPQFTPEEVQASPDPKDFPT